LVISQGAFGAGKNREDNGYELNQRSIMVDLVQYCRRAALALVMLSK